MIAPQNTFCPSCEKRLHDGQKVWIEQHSASYCPACAKRVTSLDAQLDRFQRSIDEVKSMMLSIRQSGS